MRIKEKEKSAILSAVGRFDAGARVFLFGSRADDAKRGGDIDLLVLSAAIGPDEKRRIRRMICDSIGDQKIDIIVASDLTDPLAKVARSSGVPLE